VQDVQASRVAQAALLRAQIVGGMIQ
jgi:hypothetical protein